MEEKMTVKQVVEETCKLLGNIWMPCEMQEQIGQINAARGNLRLVLEAFASNEAQRMQEEQATEAEKQDEEEQIISKEVFGNE